MGGELGYNINFTSLTRKQANFDAITQTALNTGTCAQHRRPRVRDVQPIACCAAFPAPTAASRRRRTGGAASPTRSARCSRRSRRCAPTPPRCRSTTIPACPTTSPPATAIWCAPCRPSAWNIAIPFISVQSWGTQTIEPIAQVIARPNEPQVGKWPNEDAQSLIFDDSNLFRVDKFSGWDRVEGGGRANYGRALHRAVQPRRLRSTRCSASPTACSGQFIRARRHHQYRPRQRPRHHPLRLCGAGRPTSPTAPIHSPRASASTTTPSPCSGSKLEASAKFDRWNVSLLYGDYAAQPELGFLDRRQGLLGTGIGQARRQLGAARRRPLRPQCQQIRPEPARPRLCRRLPHFGPELHYQLHLRDRNAVSSTIRSCCS